MKKYLLIVMVMCIALAGCTSSEDIYVELLTGSIESLDTAHNAVKSSQQMMADIYVGPTQMNGDNQVVNYGAKSIDVSADGLVYTLNLRDDVKWVDSSGNEQGMVTADDYVFAYQRMVDPANAPLYSYIFEGIENAPEIIIGEKDVDSLGVRAIDDYTLEIKLSAPIPYYTSLIAFGSYVAQPREAYEQYGDQYATSADTMWYSGPYYVSSYDPDYVVSINKNPLYFNSDNVEVEQIDYRLNTDDTSRLNAVLNGEADYAEIDTIENYKAAQEAGIDSIRPTMFTYYFVLNTDESSTTSNQTLRQALSSGFDRETVINAVYEGMNVPIEYIIPQDMTTGTYDGLEYRKVAGESITTYDPDLANTYFDQYMDEMGYTSREQIEISYLLNGETGNVAIAEVVQAFYKEQYGITINIDTTTGGDYQEKSLNGGFDILLTGWSPDFGDPSTYLALWKSSAIGSQNYALYDDSKYDQMYEQANSISDPQARFEAFSKCEKKLVDEAVLIPAYQKKQAYVIDPKYDFPEFLITLISHEYLTVVE